jgi:hypothetical protein
MNAQFTPGPWVLDAEVHGDLIEDGYHFIDAGIGYHSETHEPAGFGIQGCMSLADARLIASAPKLFECLRLLTEKGIGQSTGLGWNVRLKMARDALAEALGEQQP